RTVDLVGAHGRSGAGSGQTKALARPGVWRREFSSCAAAAGGYHGTALDIPSEKVGRGKPEPVQPSVSYQQTACAPQGFPSDDVAWAEHPARLPYRAGRRVLLSGRGRHGAPPQA